MRSNALISEVRDLIEQARQYVAQTATSTLTMLYWKVGERVRREVLREGRAEYGEEIVSTLSTQLVISKQLEDVIQAEIRHLRAIGQMAPDIRVAEHLNHTRERAASRQLSHVPYAAREGV